MKLSRTTIYLLLGIVSLGIMQSCSDDNENPSQNPSSPSTLTFSNIDHIEFKMWTNGAEVNTDALSIADYMDPEDYNSISTDYYQSQAGITFKDDSLFSEVDGLIVGYPYYISNDSIYLTVTYTIEGQEPFVFNQLFAMGNTTELYIPQSYYKVVDYSGTGSSEFSVLNIGHYSFADVADETGTFATVSDIQGNDTLIIYNQRANYN